MKMRVLGAVAWAVFAAWGGEPVEYTGGEALWWMTPAAEEITVVNKWDGSETTAGDLGVNAARVRATDGTTTAYLNVIYCNEQGKWVVNADQPWSAVMETPVKGAWVDVSDPGYGSAAWSFAIELGNWTATSEEASWVTMAESESATYADLKAKYIHSGDLSKPGYVAWNPSQYRTTAVPEPSSGLLLLIGGALMALRRRRRA
ncbi:MAG: PEP-CTERM sorting domain-containing protein [Kiritimatiellia bacterium]